MRKIIGFAIILSCLISSSYIQAETFEIDKVHSSIEFKIRHLVSNMKGSFNDFNAKIEFDENDKNVSSVVASVQTASIDTNNDKRDNHLKGEDFFDVEKHPEMTFQSKKVEFHSDSQASITGDFTLLGVTKEVVFETEYLGSAKAFGTTKIGFTATTAINRKDFGMQYNRVLDSGGVVVGDKVEITIEIEAHI